MEVEPDPLFINHDHKEEMILGRVMDRTFSAEESRMLSVKDAVLRGLDHMILSYYADHALRARKCAQKSQRPLRHVRKHATYDHPYRDQNADYHCRPFALHLKAISSHLTQKYAR